LVVCNDFHAVILPHTHAAASKKGGQQRRADRSDMQPCSKMLQYCCTAE
jgi:hypothetical protein